MIRVDAGRLRGLSYGHVYRCLDIARELWDGWGCEATFLMRGHEEAQDFSRGFGFGVEFFDPTADPDRDAAVTARTAKSLGRGWVLLDLPYEWLDEKYVETLRKAGLRVVMIDDARFDDLGCEGYLNSSILAHGRMTKRGPGKLLGPDYLPFRPQRLANRERVLAGGGRPRVGLTFGGSDPTRITPCVVDALLSDAGGGADFLLVLGPGYGPDEQLEGRLSGHGEWRVLRAPENLLAELAGCDLVVCSGGRTMYELYHLGIPFLPVATTPQEAEAISEFQRQGLVTGCLVAWDVQDFKKTFWQVLERVT